jgi:CRP/FNR family transcriptional regulator
MRKRSKIARGTLFGEQGIDPLGHLSAYYPFPARLDQRYVERLKASRLGRLFRKGTILFQEGENPTGIYVVLEGRAKLSVNSAEGKTLVLGFFGPGTVLGLAAAVLGRSHAATAEIVRPTKVLFIARTDLVRKIRGNATAARQAAELVSEACFFILNKMKAIDLSESAGQRLAGCLLGLLAGNSSSSEEVPINLDLSQETIAQMVGLSRETVSRLLSVFRRKGIVKWTRAGLLVQDRGALDKLANLEAVSGHSRGSETWSAATFAG